MPQIAKLPIRMQNSTVAMNFPTGLFPALRNPLSIVNPFRR
jgi:hypothetical protein